MPDDGAERVSPPDRDVEARFASGDVAAFEALFRAWQAEVFRWVVRIVRDRAAAEDVTADAFWRAYRSRVITHRPRSPVKWSRIDLGIAAATVLAIVTMPNAWLLVAYHF